MWTHDSCTCRFAEKLSYSSHWYNGLCLCACVLDWPLGTLIWPVCHSLFIPYPSSSIRSSAQLVLILCLLFSVSEWADRNSMNSCQLHDALKIFLISSHFPFHIFTLHFIFCLSHACCCLKEEKIKLNYTTLNKHIIFTHTALPVCPKFRFSFCSVDYKYCFTNE